MAAAIPIRLRFADGFRKGGWLGSCKASVAIIEKNRYGLLEPNASHDQIDSMVSIDIARRNLKAANGRDNLNGLSPSCRQPELNPVVSLGEITLPGLNAGKIRMTVAIEVGNRKRQSRSR